MALTDNTAPKQQIGRPFQPGQSGNPNGRPKGSRNKVSEKFLEALANHFEVHGEAAIDIVYKERPHDYLKIVASVLPKRMELEDATLEKHPRDMTDDELNALLWKQYKAEGVTEQDIAEAKRLGIGAFSLNGSG